MNHIMTAYLPPSPDDTPRSNEACRADPHGQETRFVSAGFSRQLERELNAANARIAALIESGDALAEEAHPDMFCNAEMAKRKRDALDGWEKAKEAKP